MVWCAVASGIWFLISIAVLSRLHTPLPAWVGVLIVPLVLLPIATAFARYAARVAVADAAQASAEEAADAVRSLADEIEAVQREARDRES